MALMPQPGVSSDTTMKRDVLLIVMAIVLAYGNAWSGSYQFDDFNTVVGNTSIHSWQAWLHKTLHGGIRPLLNFSYMINSVSGFGSTGFHGVNILIHVVTTMFVYQVSRYAVDAWLNRGMLVRQSNLVPLCTALLFALHPVHTEAVTYISGRSASLMAMLYLAGVLAYVRGIRSGNIRWIYLISPFLLLAAIAVKEVALSLPLMLLAWERVVQRTAWKEIARRQSVHWALVLVIFVLILNNPRYAQLLMYSFTIRSFHDTIFAQINGITYLLGQLVRIGSMNIDPDVSGFTERNWLLVWGWVSVVAAALWQSRNRPWFLLAVCWLVVALLPSNSLIPRTDIVNERHLYLANVGIMLCGTIMLLNINMSRRNVPLLGILLVVLACFTLYRNSDYRSEISLWEQTAKVSPHKSRVFNNLGCAYQAAAKYDLANAAYGKALTIQPDNRVASANLKQLAVRRTAPE